MLCQITVMECTNNVLHALAASNINSASRCICQQPSSTVTILIYKPSVEQFLKTCILYFFNAGCYGNTAKHV